MYERIKDATNTDVDSLTEDQKNSLDTQLQEFGVYMKKCAPFLKKTKDEMASYLTSKQHLIKAYSGTAASMAAYEDENLAEYVDRDPSKSVLNNADHGNMIESLKHTVENLRNPFTDLYHWVKGEIYDLSAFTATLTELKATADGVESMKNKIKQTKADVDNIQQGKKTMNTLFKNSGDVHTI